MNNQQAINLLKGLEQSLDDYCELNDEGKTAFGMAITALELFGNSEQLPSAQLERKRGQWEMLQMPISPPVYKCSVCGSHALQSMTGCLMNRHYEANLTNYCPNCGARMEVDDESN